MIIKEYNNFYITPAIRLYFDTQIQLEFVWFKWTLAFIIKM
jgi:hypothetical protein